MKVVHLDCKFPGETDKKLVVSLAQWSVALMAFSKVENLARQ